MGGWDYPVLSLLDRFTARKQRVDIGNDRLTAILTLRQIMEQKSIPPDVMKDYLLPALGLPAFVIAPKEAAISEIPMTRRVIKAWHAAAWAQWYAKRIDSFARPEEEMAKLEADNVKLRTNMEARRKALKLSKEYHADHHGFDLSVQVGEDEPLPEKPECSIQ